jgi:transcriptional regulator with XRE-family HTH domain
MRLSGEVIIRHRWFRGLTQRELAARSGLSPNTIFSIENGISGGSPSTARKIADALGVNVDDLLNNEGEGTDGRTEAQVS